MHSIYELKEMLMKELEEYGKKGELTGGSLEIVDKLAHAIKNLCKIIEAAEEESEYSSEGGNMGGSGNSYEYSREGGSSRYSGRGGSYARGRGGNARRDSRGRYSSEGGGGSYRGGSYRGGYSRAEDDMDDMISELREMMMELPQEKQQEVRRFIDKMERMGK